MVAGDCPVVTPLEPRQSAAPTGTATGLGIRTQPAVPCTEPETRLSAGQGVSLRGALRIA